MLYPAVQYGSGNGPFKIEILSRIYHTMHLEINNQNNGSQFFKLYCFKRSLSSSNDLFDLKTYSHTMKLQSFPISFLYLQG